MHPKNKKQVPIRIPAIVSEGELFNLNLSACFFELRLDGVSLILGNLFLDGLRATVNQRLSFLQTETGDLANNLDNSDLTGARGLQDNVELSLSSSSACACISRTGNSNSSGGGYAELILYSVYEICKLENCEGF